MRRGGRFGLNKLKVTITPGGQYRVTIPKKLAHAMFLSKGSILSFQYIKEDMAYMVRVG